MFCLGSTVIRVSKDLVLKNLWHIEYQKYLRNRDLATGHCMPGTSIDTFFAIQCFSGVPQKSYHILTIALLCCFKGRGPGSARVIILVA